MNIRIFRDQQVVQRSLSWGYDEGSRTAFLLCGKLTVWIILSARTDR